MFTKFKLSKFTTDNRGLLLKLAYSWCHDRTLAEDLLQDATEKALKSISRIKNSKAIKAWFIQIMLNCWRDSLRKKQQHQDIDELILSESNDKYDLSHFHETTTPEDNLSQSQTQLRVKNAISCLPVKYRTVLTLVDIYGASYSEVSQIVEVPMGTVMSRISRARDELRKKLSVESGLETVIPLHSHTVLRGEE